MGESIQRNGETDTIQGRIRYWRESVLGLGSAEELLSRLPGDDWKGWHKNRRRGGRPAKSSAWNYENPDHSPPPGDYLSALIHTFEDLNPTWLLTGEGEPSLSGEARVRQWEREFEALADTDVDAKEFGQALLDEGSGGLVTALHERGVGYLRPEALLALTGMVSDAFPGDGDDDHELMRRDLARDLVDMVAKPLRDSPHFVSKKELSGAEVTTFVLALVAALRPLLHQLREGREPRS